MKTSVLGSGCWGTAVAFLLSTNGHDVMLHSRNPCKIHSINATSISPDFPEFSLSSLIKATNKILDIVQSQFIFLALPTQSTHAVLEELTKFNLKDKCFIICSKGIECKTLMLISEIIEKLLPGNHVVVLSGPNFAHEIVKNQYSASTLACSNLYWAKKVRDLLESNKFKISVTNDIISVQLCGSLKNVVAILCGILKAKNYGNNTHAATITMAMKEIIKFSLAKGGKIETMLDYCGIGDLLLTCCSENSRNMRLGINYVKNISNTIEPLTEGFYTSESAIKLAHKLQLKDLHVFETVYNIIHKKSDIDCALQEMFSKLDIVEYL